MITLFHGSNIDVPKPLVKIGRGKVDFGQGFYLTKLRKQAESWAEVIAERKGRNVNPILSSYSFDYDSVKSAGYKIKVLRLITLNGWIMWWTVEKVVRCSINTTWLKAVLLMTMSLIRLRTMRMVLLLRSKLLDN